MIRRIPPCMTGQARRDDAGYATVAVVAAIVAFALLALAVQTAGTGALATVDAEQSQARATAAADAGLALALAALLSDDPGSHWSPDGKTRQDDFDGSRLAISIIDEQSKIPINLLTEEQVTRLLQLLGLRDDRLEIARDSLLDWIDEDDEARPFGAEAPWYAQSHIAPRNGGIESIDELALIRGFDPALVERLRPIVTTYWSNTPFVARYASPEALAVMTEAQDDSPDVIERKRELEGQTTALDFTQGESLTGHVVSVTVNAREPRGGAAKRTWVVKLTGNAARPYVIMTVS